MQYTNEQQLLRLITLHPKTILECGDLKPEHFSVKFHGSIFAAISKIYDEKREVSLTSTSVEIGEKWASDILSGLASVTVDGGASALANSIINAHVGAVSSELLSSYSRLLVDSKNPIQGILELITRLGKITNEKSSDRLVTADIVADEILHKLRNPDTERTSIKTGISKLDEHTGGVQHSLLTIVSGVPGMGKSTLLANMIVNMAAMGEYPYLSSLEDRSLYVVGRMISRLATVNAESINKVQNIGFSELRSIESSIERNREILKRIHIDDSSGQSVAGIRRTCSMLQDAGKMTVSFVDHLGEISKNGRNKYDAATANAEGLRDIANDLCIPVISGAQVSRSAVSNSASGGNINHMDCIPRSHHLRDSGRIEEVARNIMFVHRPHKWNSKENESDFWINIDKATHGKTKIIKLKSRLETMEIMDDEQFYEQ